MGFTMRDSHKDKPMVPAHRARVLDINVKAHGRQAKIAGGLAAGSLALGGAYKYKQKRLSKAAGSSRDRVKRAGNAALDTGAVGVGATQVGAGGYMAGMLGRAAVGHADNIRVQRHNLASANKGAIAMGAKERAWATQGLKTSRRVIGVKGAGALASAGVAGMGGKTVYEATRRKKSPRGSQS